MLKIHTHTCRAAGTRRTFTLTPYPSLGAAPESGPGGARSHARSHGAHVVGKLGLALVGLAADRAGVRLDDAERLYVSVYTK